MDYLLDLLQGLGIAAAIGIRPFLPTLVAGALAAGNVGIDFTGTSFAFLEKAPFLIVTVVLLVIFAILERRNRVSQVAVVLLVITLVLGALQASGSIADHSEDWWPGVPIGVAAASLGYLAATSLFGRVRARVDADAAGGPPLSAAAAAPAAAR